MGAADVAFTGALPETYDRCLGPMLFEPFARELAGRFRGFEGRILETAAGTGRLTRALAQAAPRASIVATDLNAPMLARAQALTEAAKVGWRTADAQDLPFGDASFDAVVCQFGVMFFPDKARAFAEARRVLAPGGRLVFSVWDRIEANDVSLAMHEALAGLFPEDPPQFLARAPFGYHDEAEIRAALGAAGFATASVETVTLETPAGSAAQAAVGQCRGSPLGAEIEARDAGGLERAIEAVTRALEARFGAGPISGRGQALVVTAHA